MWDLLKLENLGLAAPPYELKRGMLNNVLKSIRPPNPNGIQSLAAIPAPYNATSDGEPFFRHTGVNVGYSLFVSNEGLTMMEAADKLFIDGMFQIVPRNLQFTQLFVIVSGICKFLYPSAIAFMTNKDEASYFAVPGSIVQEATGANITINPVELVFDFELAAANAAFRIWPGARRNFCKFHFGYNLRKHVQQDGLLPVINMIHPPNHNGVPCVLKDIYKKAKALPWLPVRRC